MEDTKVSFAELLICKKSTKSCLNRWSEGTVLSPAVVTPSYRSMFPSPVPVPELSPGCSSPQLPPSQPARAEVLPPRQVTHSHLHHHRHGDFTALFKILENLLDEERIFKMQSLGRIVPYDSFPVYYPVLSFFFFFYFKC